MSNDLDRIDGGQPEHVAYNPSYGGLNLNFNRVHFEWKKRQDDYEVTMQARATIVPWSVWTRTPGPLQSIFVARVESSTGMPRALCDQSAP